MNILAYVRLINRKINSAHNKAQNPFTDGSFTSNPFSRPLNHTLVWIEADEQMEETPNSFINK